MRERDERAAGYISVLAAALLWSAGGLLIKLIPWSAFSINAARCLVALFFKFAVRGSFRIKFTPRSALGGAAMAATTTMFAFANKLTTSANAIMLQYSFPMFLILFVWLQTKQRPKKTDVLTSIIIVGGVFLCCLDSLGSGRALGDMLAVASGITFALYFFINTTPKALPGDANCIGFLLSFLIGFPSLIGERDFSFVPVLYAVLLGAFQLGLAYSLLEYGIRRIPAISASFITAIEPVMNPVWVAIFYGERIGLYAVAGSCLVVAAMVFYSVVSGKRQTKPG